MSDWDREKLWVVNLPEFDTSDRYLSLEVIPISVWLFHHRLRSNGESTSFAFTWDLILLDTYFSILILFIYIHDLPLWFFDVCRSFCSWFLYVYTLLGDFTSGLYMIFFKVSMWCLYLYVIFFDGLCIILIQVYIYI